jgi:IclR family acetate operon transcriptional repressor
LHYLQLKEVAMDTTAAPDGPTRALQVVETLAAMKQPASLDALAVATGLGKPKAYRVLRALQEAGYVDHVGRAGYRVGGRSIGLASLIGPRPALLRRAVPVLNRLAKLSSETATLHLRSGTHRVLVLSAETADWELRQAVRLGERAPLTSGCSGLVILAHLPPAETEAIVAGRPRSEPRPTHARLRRIRQNGYDTSQSANHQGVSGIAVPLLDPDDASPLASMAIAGPESRLPERVLDSFATPLITAAREFAPLLATMLGPNSTMRQEALNVTITESFPLHLPGRSTLSSPSHS